MYIYALIPKLYAKLVHIIQTSKDFCIKIHYELIIRNL